MGDLPGHLLYIAYFVSVVSSVFVFAFLAHADYYTTVTVGCIYPDIETNPSARELLRQGDYQDLYSSVINNTIGMVFFAFLSLLFMLMAFYVRTDWVAKSLAVLSIGIFLIIVLIIGYYMWVIYNNIITTHDVCVEVVKEWRCHARVSSSVS